MQFLNSTTQLIKISIALFICLMLNISVHAQEIKRSSINSIGTSRSSENIRISQSVGQAGVTGTAVSNSTTLRQGFQQPLILTSEDETREIQITVFPNPNNGEFTFLTNLADQEHFSYQIADAAGKILRKDNCVGGQRVEVQLASSTQSGAYTMFITTEKNWKGNTTIIITK